MTRRERLVAGIMVATGAYVLVASSVYRFQHPAMSETELFLHLWDAMAWR